MGSAPTEGTPTVELRDVSKAFGQVIALRSGSLALYPGSIHALVGENGAGKPTLVKIMAGLYQRDSGSFEMEGKPVDFKTTAEAKAAGIAVIYQEPTLFPDLSSPKTCSWAGSRWAAFAGSTARQCAPRSEA